MGLIKSIFVNLYFTAGAVASAHAAWALYEGGLNWSWVGALIACLPVPLYLASLYVSNKPRTHPHLPQLLAPAVVGSAVVLVQLTGPALPIWPLIHSLGVGIVAGLLYVYWYSISAPPPVALTEGAKMQDFTLRDETGAQVKLSEQKSSYSLLMFFRGNWCPLCMAQVREVSRQYQALAERGVQVFLISPQPDGHTRALSKRFDAPMRFLVNDDNRLAKQLGILNKHGLPMGMDVLGYDRDAPHPTIILCDSNLRIVALDVATNYRVRPDPAEYLEAINAYEQSGGTAAAPV